MVSIVIFRPRGASDLLRHVRLLRVTMQMQKIEPGPFQTAEAAEETTAAGILVVQRSSQKVVTDNLNSVR